MLQAITPESPWFWIIVGVGTAVFLAAIRWGVRWLWLQATESFLERVREGVRAPVEEARVAATVAEERATVAAEHVEQVKETLGEKNGNGNLMTMASRVLANQHEQFDWQREHQANNDAMAATLRDTRGDVIELKSNVAAILARLDELEATRPPFASTEDPEPGGTR